MMRTRWPELLRSRVKLIARTETAKASAALTRARCDDLSLDWVEWLTSEDARVRVSHKKMDKVLFRWSDMPDPEALVGEKPGGHYGPGEVFNCRCSSAPLLSASDLSWPRRVYANGSIKQMTLQQFKALSGMTERAAA
jgi:SPP1 gp7 family putative phage head morphogenesis protein